MLIDCLEIITDIFARYAPSIQSKSSLQSSALAAFLTALNHNNAGVKKRAMNALGTLGACATSEIFTEMCAPMLEKLSSGNQEAKKSIVQLTSVLARTSSKRIGRRLPEFMPRILPLALTEDEDETREVTLQTLETLLLRCPSEVTPFMSQCIDAACSSISHDPNYAGGEDSDEDMEDEMEDDEEFDMEDYEDDEDLSWKVRRASAKMLNAAISTRPEMLVTFAERVAPLLVSRSSDREETVRIEVFNTLIALLKQTQLYSGSPQATEVMNSSPIALKRKLSDMEDSDTTR